jgi:hypothetical protein
VGAERKVNWEPMPNSLFSGGVPSPPKSPTNKSDINSDCWLEDLWKDLLVSEYAYHCIPLDKVYTIYKKRYELKLQALEISDTSGYSIIFSCNGVDKADKIFQRLLQFDLPQSIFNNIGVNMLSVIRGLAGNFYNSFLSYLIGQLTKLWQNNELSNFQYLMHLNAASKKRRLCRG